MSEIQNKANFGGGRDYARGGISPLRPVGPPVERAVGGLAFAMAWASGLSLWARGAGRYYSDVVEYSSVLDSVEGVRR